MLFRSAGKLSVVDQWRLKRSFDADKIIRIEWCASDSTWDEAVAKVDIASRAIVAVVQAMSPELRKNLVLVGHSLGGRVVAHSLSKLGKQGLPVKTAALLAPAMSAGDKEAEKMDVGCSSLIIVVGENDFVLEWLYPLVTGECSATDASVFCEKKSRYAKYVVPDWFSNLRDGISHDVSVHIEYLELARSGMPVSLEHEDAKFFVDFDMHGFLLSGLAAAANSSATNITVGAFNDAISESVQKAAESVQKATGSINRSLNRWRSYRR